MYNEDGVTVHEYLADTYKLHVDGVMVYVESAGAVARNLSGVVDTLEELRVPLKTKGIPLQKKGDTRVKAMKQEEPILNSGDKRPIVDHSDWRKRTKYNNSWDDNSSAKFRFKTNRCSCKVQLMNANLLSFTYLHVYIRLHISISLYCIFPRLLTECKENRPTKKKGIPT